MHDRPPARARKRRRTVSHSEKPDDDRTRELKQARDRKRYRRQLAGRACCQVEFTSEMVDYLVKYHWLDKANAKAPDKAKAEDRDNIGDAISRAMQDAAEADAK